MPGVEMKLSARESVGESSNLMWGVVDMAVLDGGCEGDGDDAGGSQLRSSPNTHYAEERWIIVWEEGFGRSSVVVVRRQSGHDG